MSSHVLSPSGPPRARARLAADLAARAFDVDLSQIYSGERRSARVAQARQAAMYLAHVGLGASFADVARAFARDPASVRHACARVEDRRDAPAFDALMGSLDHAAGSFASAFGLARSAAPPAREAR